MEKVVKIEGMTCSHCLNRVDKALNKIESVKALVDLEKAQATIIGDVSDEMIIKTIKDAGYEVVSIN